MFKQQFNLPKNAPKEEKEELVEPREELMQEKREYLEAVKEKVRDMFGEEELPKDLVEEMVGVRKEIKAQIGEVEFVDEISDEVDEKIKSLFARILYYKDFDEVEGVYEMPEEGAEIRFKDGRVEKLGEAEVELMQSMRMYFDSYRMVLNAGRFRESVSAVRDDVEKASKERVKNVYSEEEKEGLLLEKLSEKYEKAGFSEGEIKALLKLSDLKNLADLEVHEIKTMAQIKDVFARFLKGDVTRYVGLSAALSISAAIQGVAPSFLADSFKGDVIEMDQVAIFAALTAIASGGDILINKHFKDFFNENSKKEGGIDEYIAESITELPAEEVGKFGTEKIKERVGGARSGYREALSLLSYNVVPAGVTLGTSMAMLYQRSPWLAAGTGVSFALSMGLNKYFYKATGYWEKERKAEEKSEEVAEKMQEQLSAHMEVILSGEKDQFRSGIKDTLTKEMEARGEKSFLSIMQENFNESLNAVHFIIAAGATALAGGSADKFIAALMYTGQFNNSLQRIISTYNRTRDSLRDITQMDLMFNGYAKEEKEKEKDRVGVSEIGGGDISLDGVDIEFGGKKILDDVDLKIPGGSMVSLQGASGGGKTTLMKLIAGYYKPSSGEVKFGGVDMGDIKKSGDDSMYSKLAYLSQFPYILEDSVRDNLTFGTKKEVSDEEIKSVLGEVGLSERFKNLDEVLRSGRGDAGVTSGGEASRLGLARVLTKIRNSDSKVVFLDEPTASVDEETSDDIARIINSEKENNPDTTFIVISHDREFVKRLDCNIDVRMKEGKILEG